MDTFQIILADQLSAAVARAGFAEAAGEVMPATDPRFGDYQTNAAMILAKQRGENPRQIAAKIIENFPASEIVDPPSIAGPGFINFTLRTAAVAQKTGEILNDERLGVPEAESKKRIVIDFGSPNVAKPMHVGHIRSAVLGDSLARIASFLGHEVIRDNHI